MKKLLLIGAIIGLIFACNQATNNGDTASDTPPPGFTNSFCDSSANAGLCSCLPYEVHQGIFVGYDSNLDSVHQAPFDVFSWQSFVALNWPADSSGNPIGSSIGSNPNAPRVWESFKDPSEVFGNNNQELLLHLGNAKEASEKFLYMMSKAPGKLHPMKGFTEADGHPLIDRNLNFALYEIKMSPAEANFVTTYNLNTVDSIGTYYLSHHDQFALPVYDSAAKTPGTTEVKAAWRILDPSKGDDTSRYYCRNAYIYIDAAHTRSGKALTFRAKVGLVGIHIFRITSRFSMGVWSTFEHIDNTPASPQDAQDNRNTRWSFYRPECLNCPLNDTPVLQPGESFYKWDSAPPFAGTYAVGAPSQPGNEKFGTQVVRQFPVFSMTDYINRLWRAKLQGTVWANYKLIGSQWQHSESFPAPNAPALLANCTLETYIQSSASCISCHSFATVSYAKKPGDTITIRTNQSFLFPVFVH